MVPAGPLDIITVLSSAKAEPARAVVARRVRRIRRFIGGVSFVGAVSLAGVAAIRALPQFSSSLSTRRAQRRGIEDPAANLPESWAPFAPRGATLRSRLLGPRRRSLREQRQ